MSQLDDGRGRQPIVSTGRGGAGNLIRSPSRGIDPEATGLSERGREIQNRDASIDRVIHSGRGGAGNIRSPSRTRDVAHEAKEDALQARLVAEERGRQAEGNFSTGRGGAGNISRSKSRSRSAVRDVRESTPDTTRRTEMRSGGRGGWGNIREERDSIDEVKREEQRKYDEEIRAKYAADGANKPHAYGKGGAGNFASGPLPEAEFAKLSVEEKEAHRKIHGEQTFVASGRGGAGNMHQKSAHSHALNGSDDSRGRGDQKGGVIGSVMRSLSRAAGKSDEKKER